LAPKPSASSGDQSSAAKEQSSAPPGSTSASVQPSVDILADLILGEAVSLLNFSLELIAATVDGGRSSSVSLPHFSLTLRPDLRGFFRFIETQLARSSRAATTAMPLAIRNHW
jgi:hypothetical protein